MQRRTFLESAATVVGGLLTWRPSLKRPVKWTPPPRWEWEVGRWVCRRTRDLAWIRNGYFVPERWEMVREWKATATITNEESTPIYHAVSACNASAFCRVASGHIQVGSVVLGHISDGLVEYQVRLRETQWRQDGVKVLDFRCKRTTWVQTMKHINFCDVFRGGHAVVEVLT